MLAAYQLEQNRLHKTPLGSNDPLPEGAIWVDALEPDEQERNWLSGHFVGDLPGQDDIDEIEASSRFFVDQDGVHINSLFPHKVGQDLRTFNVSFNLRDDLLISVREEDLSLFRLVRQYLRQERIQAARPLQLLLQLFALKVDYLSDAIEDVYNILENVSDQVFETDHLDSILRLISKQEDANGKIRLSLLDTQRTLRFLQRYDSDRLTKDNRREIKQMLADIESLLPHTQFLFDKINFMLDATVSFTNLEQNKIIKIFSVAAVMFLPPTLIASIYGMNFALMPELSQRWGYPMALGLMVASAVGTYGYFKRKGWL
ncbi:magnesium transport protein CorA [Marinobacterium nitratireducens]|uniref:Magnesium transport protein CorA n=1 Tax=Marinobacterium nitratireducens TaxID=518897 RepID=A0A917ZQP0_9GAMM|nr:magnesium/cobalt transporter CorA [Marinobacterium nitratireducens]GGO88016.1 magnesium transport protein CorA [Marinobacterium nitratireducens]